MIIHEEEYDLIRIDLEEVFGKVIELSANDAERLIHTDPILILVLRPDQGAIFQTLVDTVVMDITGRLSDKLDDDGIEVEMPYLNIYIKQESVSQEGLRIINEAVQLALTTGTLSYFQAGAPGYEVVEHANKNKYQHALNTMAAAQAFRNNQRVRITQRPLN